MKNKLTKIEKAVMLTQFMHILNGKTYYTEEDVAGLHDRIRELEAEVALLRENEPKMPDHENIRGAEYYK